MANFQKAEEKMQSGDYINAEKPYPRTDTKYARTTELALDANAQVEWLREFLPAGTFIAGGFVSGLMNGTQHLANDLDLFFRNREALNDAIEVLMNHGFEPDPDAYKHIDLTTYRLKADAKLGEVPFFLFRSPRPEDRPVQAICFVFYEDAEAVIDDFDFTATQYAIDIDKGEVVYNPASAAHVAAKGIVIHRHEPDASLLKRLAKYHAKGFRPLDPEPWLSEMFEMATKAEKKVA